MQDLRHGAIAAAALAAATAAVEAGTIEVIYTEIPGHPTAVIPGSGGLEFTGLLDLHHSPSGSHWIFKGFANDVENDVIVVGSGTSGEMVAREAQPTAVEGTTHSFLDSDCGVNDSGHYIYGSRLDGATTATDEIVFLFDGTDTVVAAREGDSAPNLFDPGVTGDELFGNSLNSVHVLSDGTPCFHADLIQNIPTAYRSALYQGSTVVAQEGLAVGSGVYSGFGALGANAFTSSADGSAWIVESDIDPDIISSVEAVVVTGSIAVQDGDVIAGLAAPVDAVTAVHMTGGGNWFARGTNTDDVRWALFNGNLLAASGDPITGGATETFTTLFTATGDDAGHVLIVGETSEPDPDLDSVLVLDGETVLVREGDPVDLDGDGTADAFIRTFSANDTFIDEGGFVYFFATLRNDLGDNLGDAFLRIATGGAIGDINGDGVVDVDDLLLLLAAWGPCPGCPEDLDGDGDVDVDDLLLLFANWG